MFTDCSDFSVGVWGDSFLRLSHAVNNAALVSNVKVKIKEKKEQIKEQIVEQKKEIEDKAKKVEEKVENTTKKVGQKVREFKNKK